MARTIAEPRTITEDEAERQLRTLLDAARDGEEVVIERGGAAAAALIPIAAYEEILALREAKRRADIEARIEALERSIGDRNSDLSDDEIDELAVRAGREIRQETIAELGAAGKISFERDRR